MDCKHFEILSLISLPEETFRTKNIGVNVKTSVLILKKKINCSKHNIFFASPRSIGYNMQGDTISSNEIYETSFYYDDINKIPENKKKYFFKKELSNEQLIDRMNVNYFVLNKEIDGIYLSDLNIDVFYFLHILFFQSLFTFSTFIF